MIYLWSYSLTDESELTNCAKKDVAESPVIVNLDTVQKYFSTLQVTSAGKGRAQAFCRKARHGARL